MCEANAYLLHEDGREELYMPEVDLIEPCAEKALRLVSIYGEQKVFQGRIKNLSLLAHKVLLVAD
jgi:predicted RNA-binding protein